MKKDTSVRLNTSVRLVPEIGENIRSGLKNPKLLLEIGRQRLNEARYPEPGVVKRAPRVLRKTLNG